MPTPVLFLLAGPNGSGKSTFYEHVLRPTAPRLEFVNADVIEAQANASGEGIDSYEAASRASDRRSELLAERRSFVTETVYSHPSKVELVKAAVDAGYLVHLHVMIIPLPVSIARVHERALYGGHDVADNKMRERYGRLWDHVVAAIATASEATVWDSSGFSSFVKVARFDRGRLVGSPAWPSWTPAPLRKRR